ncbi:hypothetical protein ACUXSM_007947 [Burkholderia sp. 132550021-2]|jgi:hypothetical protein
MQHKQPRMRRNSSAHGSMDMPVVWVSVVQLGRLLPLSDM